MNTVYVSRPSQVYVLTKTRKSGMSKSTSRPLWESYKYSTTQRFVDEHVLVLFVHLLISVRISRNLCTAVCQDGSTRLWCGCTSCSTRGTRSRFRTLYSYWRETSFDVSAEHLRAPRRPCVRCGYNTHLFRFRMSLDDTEGAGGVFYQCHRREKDCP
jgi:hypothetical protein